MEVASGQRQLMFEGERGNPDGHDVLEQMHVQREFEHARGDGLGLRVEVSCRLQGSNRRSRNNVLIHTGREFVRTLSAFTLCLHVFFTP